MPRERACLAASLRGSLPFFLIFLAPIAAGVSHPRAAFTTATICAKAHSGSAINFCEVIADANSRNTDCGSNSG